MMTTLDPMTDAPVRKTVTVKASAAHAFRVFTEGFDSWWPRTHHIGASPMTRAIVEGFAGGRCYNEQADHTECDWGRVLTWDPPHRLVIAWMISNEWKFEPDLAKASEVDVRFTQNPDGTTRVDLEHHYFTRHGAGWETHRNMVDTPDGGWYGLLLIFAKQAESTAAQDQA
jgi:uncharacterized protein YndB with AHSA1/START domain